jgi:hypothetical protein
MQPSLPKPYVSYPDLTSKAYTAGDLGPNGPKWKFIDCFGSEHGPFDNEDESKRWAAGWKRRHKKLKVYKGD